MSPRCTSGHTRGGRGAERPREVVQEVYRLPLAHPAIRTLPHRAAHCDGLDSNRICFTGALTRAAPRLRDGAAHLTRALSPFCVNLLSGTPLHGGVLQIAA